MKYFLTSLLWILSLGMFTVAQQADLTKLYTLLDRVIHEDRSRAEVILETLSTFQSQTQDQEKLALIESIRSYIDTKLNPPIPVWYTRMPAHTLDTLSNIVHLQWPSDAPIAVIEFVDFQCPYCQKQHFNKILDNLREIEYPGKVRTAVAMFPLSGKRHELAQQAAESAECAFIQWGIDAYYWHKEYLYNQWLQPTEYRIKNAAKSVWLDPDRLRACVSEWHATARVANQKNLGIWLWVRWTPGTVVVDTRSWAYKTVRGAVGIESFMPIVEELYNAG